jgi:glutamate dehydrogenase
MTMARDNGSDQPGTDLRAAVLAHLDGDAARFGEAVFGSGTLVGTARLDAAAIADDVRDALGFVADKPRDRHKLQIKPSHGGRITLVEILNDDMPFLVDSVMAEVQARGHTVLLVVHPLFKTQRNGDGRLQSILGSGDRNWSDGHQESLIAIYLDAMPPADAADLGRALSEILADVRLAVGDWQAMLHRVERAQHDLARAPVAPMARVAAADVLKWLLDGNFTFLGLSELRYETDDALRTIPGTELGLLRSPDLQVLRRGGKEIALGRSDGALDAPLTVSKASALSRVHRRVHMDFIAVQSFNGDSRPIGEMRILGLFTSKAYTQAAGDIPLIRPKVDAVLAQSGHPPQSHAGKALVNILDTFPRDELFQIDTETLAAWSQGILDLEMRPRVRVFARPDRYGRFVSVLVYVPRDRYTSQVRERIGALLATACDGHITAFHPHFFEGPLLRVQFIVATPAGRAPSLDLTSLERNIADIVRTWDDRFVATVADLEPGAAASAARYRDAFPSGYTDDFSASRALEDIRRIERLVAGQGVPGQDPVAIDFYHAPGAPAHELGAAVARIGAPLRLSDRVPVLENLGFTVIDERSYRISPAGLADGAVALHHMRLESADGKAFDLAHADLRLEDAYGAVTRGDADNDLFNRLVAAAGADWREAALMRAYGAYIRQLNTPFGLRYLAETLLRHSAITRDLIALFHLRLDPDRTAERAQTAALRQRIVDALSSVPSADEDRILRVYLNLIETTLRTNYYQHEPRGGVPLPLALKFDSKAIDIAPQPKPYREIWVYSPRVEGVHLRFAPIARGGIRWSDRAQDFRTEVLGLVKAQLVKNAVIVPSGAKGGFLPKQLPRSGVRDEIQKEGVAAYKLFIGALLSVTDNLIDGQVVAPARVMRHDGDDPYLVVAADKGTATFSDTANELARLHGHWLGDAFASGGSVGYDHKKMAITARGGWECVKRHFRELSIDIQKTPFRAAGIGDMSGDVFGNGMLLSPVTKLVAAFDHRDIFLDPDPDPTISFAERKRVFDLPRSSWQDYDKAKLSAGGGIFARSAKSIPLSAQVKALLKLDGDTATPQDMMRAILKADVDLFWLGGIGTYVRASSETDEQVGDRANDAVRVTAAEFGAKVIGEGANLGLTQRSRVELAQRGVRLNTDFIDNSAGVNSSDLEVNIKIALGRVTTSGELTGEPRRAFLAAMTDEVAAACLVNNYQQSLALSLSEARAAQDTRAHARLMRDLEKRRLLDRRLEALPNDTDLIARHRAGKPLTRPELAVLSSYSKIALTDDLLASALPDQPHTRSLLKNYAPQKLRATYQADVANHRLAREIIATAITNAVINRAGPAFVTSIAEETGRSTADVATAYLAATTVHQLDDLNKRIDALDARIPGRQQNDLYLEVQALLRSTMRDLLRDGRVLTDYAGAVEAQRQARQALLAACAGAEPLKAATQIEATRQANIARGVPPDLAFDLACMGPLAEVPALVRLAHDTGVAPVDAARALFGVGDDLNLAQLKAKAATLNSDDEYEALAIQQAVQQMAAAQAGFARADLAASARGSAEHNRWQAAFKERTGPIRPLLDQISGGETVTVSRLVVAATRLRDLADGMQA